MKFTQLLLCATMAVTLEAKSLAQTEYRKPLRTQETINEEAQVKVENSSDVGPATVPPSNDNAEIEDDEWYSGSEDEEVSDSDDDEDYSDLFEGIFAQEKGPNTTTPKWQRNEFSRRKALA